MISTTLRNVYDDVTGGEEAECCRAFAGDCGRSQLIVSVAHDEDEISISEICKE